MKRGVSEKEAWRALAPAIVLLSVVTLLPMIYVLYLSMQYRSVFQPPGFAGAQHYVYLIGDARFWNALANTSYFAFVSVAAELLLGLGFALVLTRVRRMRVLVYALVLIPWAIPTVVSARIWEWMYNAEIGVLNYLVGARVNWLGDPAWALHAAIMMDVWKSTPFVTLLLFAGLQGIPRDLYYAASVDGASAWRQFYRITLPLLAPVILVVLVFRTIDALRVFDSLYVLTGGGPANTTESLSIYAYKALFQALDFGYGSAISVTMLVLAGVATLIYARLLSWGGQ